MSDLLAYRESCMKEDRLRERAERAEADVDWWKAHFYKRNDILKDNIQRKKKAEAELANTQIAVAHYDIDLKRVRAERNRLRRMADQWWDLINNSRGVDGLHLNGDLATWEDLLPGGRFEEWLSEMETEADDALAGGT